WDAFGLPAENAAMKRPGLHPQKWTVDNIAKGTRELKMLGILYDWDREVAACDPDYYKWTQWLFLLFYERGLAYRAMSPVNWCPVDKTVLANEQVINGACERCGTQVEQRFLEQWFFSITDYAGRLLDNLDRLDWSESTKTAQRNWIGKSEGAEVAFRVQDLMEFAGSATVSGGGMSGEVIPTPVELRVFTTRPDTIFGATFLVVAPEHPLADLLTTDEQRAEVEAYREAAAKQDIVTRKVNKDKTGVFTGSYAVNPASGELMPVWMADYVLMEYGTGAIMAVPGHDERDFEFARKFGLPTPRVVGRDLHDTAPPTDAAFTESVNGVMVNSGQFNGLTVPEAKHAIVAWLAERGSAKPVVNYRLHDWCISRQRYWGPPIPIIYCDACGPVPVPESDLPVVLPPLEDFKPDDSGVSPLARDEAWYRVSCPQCGKAARRETDVSDTFLDSSWYFLRYPSANRDDVAFDPAVTRHWLPVNSYIGGNEHAVLHLLYSRFITMVLHDAGLLEFEEPFTRFRAHGTIIREGAKMSKSRGNVVNPDEYVEKWGADAFRTYLMFLGPYEEGGDFRDQSISGVRRFLDRLWASVHEATRAGDPDAAVMRKLHQTIRKVTDDIPALSYNTAIAAMMEYVNVLRAHERTPHAREVEPLVQLVAPFAPHAAEELWEVLGHDRSVFDAGWPAFDAALAAEESVTVAVQVNGKTRGTVQVPKDAEQPAVLEAAMADAGIAKFVTGSPKKVIYVRNRLLNVVV
ncbi:MAG: leucine--tRNA ligase, partial [Gemmatimonadota bacterium]|nr:leucine--tRNA ligase [Gemmatimonadota bacterium]